MMEALVFRRLKENLEVSPTLLDIQELNNAALAGKYDITKISAATLPLVRDHYELLDSGSAMGFGCGPILISKEHYTIGDLSDKVIGIPGKNTTAHYLFNHFVKKFKEKKYLVFNQIESACLDGTIDAGVMIHEGRFTYQSKGLKLIADLGTLWEEEHHLPIPLGVLVAKKSLGAEKIKKIERCIKESIQYASDHPEVSKAYIADHAQEMSPEVTKMHIDLYVNQFSLSMGKEGRNALNFLLSQPS